ncbi:MAG: ATP-binding protein [Planctomycetota bacterium]
MGTRTIVIATWPVIATSLLLLGLGVLAAWWVDKTQSDNSLLIAQEVHGVVAAQDLYTKMREFRRNLDLFLRTNNEVEFNKIASHRKDTQRLLIEAKKSARTPTEQQLIEVVERGYIHFYDEYQRISVTEPKEEQKKALSVLVDQILTKEVLEPAQKCVDYNRQVIDTSNLALNQTAKRIRIGFILLGLCGSLAGLALGVGVALNLRKTMVKLHVSVQGVAGRLTEVLGPVTLSEGTTMQELQLSLQAMEQHIAEVVERLQRQDLEILRREQLASLGQMAAGLAHELRNPLMPMKMLVQSAVQKGDDGPGLRGRSLMVMSEEISRMETSLQAFLDFARPPQLEKNVFDMRTLCVQTLELVSARAAQQEVQLAHRFPDHPVQVYADASQFRQVLLNLVLNALDALPDGGKVEVRVETRADDQASGRLTPDALRLAEFALAPTGLRESEDGGSSDNHLSRHALVQPSRVSMVEAGWCVVSVRDNGIGMPPELVERIFEPFVTTKETGHGLGLSTCRRVVQAHGGTISAVNRPDGGAVFTFRLRMIRDELPSIMALP